MTTLAVNTIEGRRGSACVNDAFAIVANDKDVLDIIPASEIPGKGSADVLNAFQTASAICKSAGEIKQVARRRLGLG